MNKLSKEKQSRIALVGLCSVGISVGLYFLVVKNQLDTLAVSVSKTAEIRSKVDQANSFLKQSATLEKKLAGISDELNQREADMVPDRDTYDAMLKTIRAFEVSRTGVFPLVIDQPRTNELQMLPKFPYKAAIFHATGRGFYHEFGRFIADFENTFRLSQIVNLDVAPAGLTSSGMGGAPLTQTDAEILVFNFDIIVPIKPSGSFPEKK